MFDLRRFARLAAAEWIENRRAWLWFLGVLVMLHFVLVLVMVSASGWARFDTDDQEGLFFLGLFATAPIFAARYFHVLGQPAPALLALMRPASTFEKWLLALLVVAVAYPLAYHLVFYVCDFPAWWMAKSSAQAELARLVANKTVTLAQVGEAEYESMAAALRPEKFRLFTLWSTSGFGWLDLLAMLLSLWMAQGFALAGSTYFRRLPFLKTLLAAFVVLLLCMLASSLAHGDPDPFLRYFDTLDQPGELASWQRVLFPLAWFGVPLLLWVGAYLALREREIAG